MLGGQHMCAIVKELWLALTSPIEQGGQAVAEAMYPEKCDSSMALYFVKTHHWRSAALPHACTKGPRGNSVRLLSQRWLLHFCNAVLKS